MSSHDLSTAPPFLALSYTWGLPHPEIHRLRSTPSRATHVISCNDKVAHIGENLHDFLTHCAQDSTWDQNTYYWIDALVIDQSNVQERSEQVKLMSKIYQAATEVVVWLGPEDDLTSTAVELMRGVLGLTDDEKHKMAPTDVSDDNPNPLMKKRSWKALSQFFQREWFNRAWIIQEVVLARSVTLSCGQHSISWEELSQFSHFLATSSWTLLLKKTAEKDENGRTMSIRHNTPARLAAAQKTWLYGDDNKFLYALIRARSSASENLRDKVYSQLGLGDADIFPSYTISVAETYAMAAEYILQHSKSLLLLTCVEGEEFQQVPGLPSWVPDWSVNKALGLRVTGYPDFHAALNLPKWSEISRDENGTRVLTVKVVRLDEIMRIGQTKSEIRTSLPTSGFWELVSMLDQEYPAAPAPGQSREEAVWRALMTNREAKGTHSDTVNTIYPASSELFGPSFQRWVLWRYVMGRKIDQIEPFPPHTQSHTLLPSEELIRETREKCKADANYLAELERQALRFDLHYSHAMLLRPFVTEKGYFGIGTQCLREQDTLWVVPGCPVPLIFRRIEGKERYRLVGGSYVHGFMNGEILQQKDLNFEVVSLE